MKKLVLASTLLMLLGMTGCGFFQYGPWQGKVIDAETQLPIEGAVVVAVWEKGYHMFPLGAASSYHDAEEILTNRNGEFHIPARRYFVSLLYGILGPKITIFKPGYGSFPEHQVSPRFLPRNLFEHLGTTVELPKFRTTGERQKKLPGLPNYVPYAKLRIYIHLLNLEAREAGLTSFYEEQGQ
jgi:hypothetical protein